jgi:hypothetical protein
MMVLFIFKRLFCVSERILGLGAVFWLKTGVWTLYAVLFGQGFGTEVLMQGPCVNSSRPCTDFLPRLLALTTADGPLLVWHTGHRKGDMY